MRLPAALAIAILAGVGGCSHEAGPSAEDLRGEVEDGDYVNAALGLELPVPEDWSLATREQMEKLVQMGTEVAAGGDSDLQAALEAGEEHTVPMVMLFKHEVGAPVAMNANLNMMAEYVGSTPGVTTAEDYLSHARKQLEATAMNYSFAENTGSMELDGVVFTIQDAQASTMGREFQQRLVVSKRDDYVLLITLTFDDKGDRDAMLDILRQMRIADESAWEE